MNRREALKKIGLSFGFLVGTPAAISLLQSCTATKSAEGWQFFTSEEADVMTKVVDIILPATTDTPSASEVNVPEFIDQYLQQVVDLEEQDRTREYLQNFIGQLKKRSGKSDSGSITEEDIEPLIAESLNKSETEEEYLHDRIDNYVDAKANGEPTELFDDVASYALLENIRGMAIWSYKTSEQVGEEILAYESIPGRQVGCIDLQEATGGKAWSL